MLSLAIPLASDGPQHAGAKRFNLIHLMTSDGSDVLAATLEADSADDRHVRAADDIIIMLLQCATHWDSLAHIAHVDTLYNGYSLSEISCAGARRNSIDKARAKIAARGVLLDLPRAQGRRWLDPGEGITSADLDHAARREGVDVRAGDIVLVRTGRMAQVREHGTWGDYVGGQAPGLALDSLEWIWSRDIAAVATDTWALEAVPSETPESTLPLHLIAMVYMGLTLGEIFDLEELGDACAADGSYAFFFAALPLPIAGAVGSPINPMVLK